MSGSAIHSEEELKWMRRFEGEFISFVLPMLSVRDLSDIQMEIMAQS